jgi:predicted negative regulator of RcsB-dependent stress response
VESRRNAGLGDPSQGIVALRDFIDVSRSRHVRQNLTRFNAYLIGLHVAAGAVDEALALLADSLEIVEKTGERQYLPALHRRGDDALALRDPRAAEAAYRQAIAVAQSQGTRV